jgi:hypothetical protein
MLKEKCFYDVKKTLFVQNEAADITLKYSKKNKRVTVIINNNKPFYIYHEKYKKRQIMRDEPNTKWCKYVEKKIKKEINKSSYNKSFIITIVEGYTQADLDTSNINIHVKKTLQFNSIMVFAYLTNKDMIRLRNKNSNKIYDVQTDSYVNIPEQVGYPPFKQQSRFSSVRINCSGNAQNPSNPQIAREWIGWRPINPITTQFPIPNLDENLVTQLNNDNNRSVWDVREERNGEFNEYLVYLFIIDTGISRHNYLSINDFRSRNYVPNNGNVDSSDWEDRNGHGTHVAGIAGGRYNVGVTFDGRPHQVISLKVLADDGSGGQSTWIFEAEQYIIQFAKEHPRASIVVNMSLAGAGGPGNIMNNSGYFESPNRIIVVCAAGNTSQDVELNNIQPANSRGSITVGNSVANAIRRCNSNFGPRIDIFAPGTNIRSTWLNNGLNNEFRQLSGTSMSAPAVAGAAVIILRILLLQYYTTVLRVQIENFSRSFQFAPGRRRQPIVRPFDPRRPQLPPPPLPRPPSLLPLPLPPPRNNTNDRNRVLCFLIRNASNLTCDDYRTIEGTRIDGCAMDVAMQSTTRRFLNVQNIFSNQNVRDCPENVNENVNP